MISIILALLAAFIYSLSAVLVRKELDKSNYLSVSLVITITGNVILWPLTFLFTNLNTINLEHVTFFIVAGILAPGIARLLYYKGMRIVGASINAAVFATYPIYSALLAAFFLEETLTSQYWIGIAFVTIGILFIQRSQPEAKFKTISKRGIVLPLLGALFVASSYIFRKKGLNLYNEPLLGVAIGYFLTLLLYFPLLLSSYTTWRLRFSSKDFRLFWKAGLCASFGLVLTYYALSYGSVSIVTPTLLTEPLFILFLSYLYLKQLEKISLKLVISTILIVFGIILVTIR